jgi:hypothetical protein
MFEIWMAVEPLQSFWWHTELKAWSAVLRRQWHVALVTACRIAIWPDVLLA